MDGVVDEHEVAGLVAVARHHRRLAEQQPRGHGADHASGQRILVPAGSSITGPKDLGGKRVCASAGSTSLQNLVALRVSPRVQPIAVANQSDCLVMLQQGEVDAISTDDTILQGLAAQDPNLKLAGGM